MDSSSRTEASHAVARASPAPVNGLRERSNVRREHLVQLSASRATPLAVRLQAESLRSWSLESFTSRAGLSTSTASSESCGLKEKSSSESPTSTAAATSSLRPAAPRAGLCGSSSTSSSAPLAYIRMASASCIAPASVTQLLMTRAGVGVLLSRSNATRERTETMAQTSGIRPQSASRAGKEPSTANFKITMTHITAIPIMPKTIASRGAL
mmetsp:Transcript_20533/g.44857  ORF Transcript_20533/g.44857 Transcript_20533/m.44857 type:complete len:211 (+) Transcript_20533:398-1030(+)